MNTHTIENKELKVTFRRKSAEMISMIKKDTGKEYLWCADAAFWGWTSPILFPFVGSLKDQQYTYEGKQYHLGQHGFARNREFDLVSAGDEEIWFALCSDEKSRELYPFEFRLEVGYILKENELTVKWKVTNTDQKELYYSIGAHPAFLCPLDNGDKQTDCYIGFDTELDTLRYRLIDTDVALVDETEYELALIDGLHRIETDRFDLDALIFEQKQTGCVYLAGPDKKPYVSVIFDAPLFGLWSPAGKGAPFVCIEPWYGRADGKGFAGSLEQRKYEEKLSIGETQQKEYKIIIH